MPFIGRTRELRALERRHASDQFECIIVYGRRRVGKTALLQHFLQGKKGAYFTGVDRGADLNLQRLSIAIQKGWETGQESHFATFEKALTFAFEHSLNERTVLILDEYPFIATADPSFASVLQHLIDQYSATSKLMLVLCGSSISYMENEVLAYRSPLYGRRTGQMRIEPFDFFDSRKMLSAFSPEDAAILYGSVGGTPLYLSKYIKEESLESALELHWFETDGFFFNETDTFLRQEVRVPQPYLNTLGVLTHGPARVSDIASKTDRETAAVVKTLATLDLLGIVRKETPYGEKNSRRSLYRLADNMFRFWFTFIDSNLDSISLAGPQAAWNSVQPQLSGYMGVVFEDICRQYLWHCLRVGNAPINFKSVERWWGTDSRTKSEAEIDIIAEADKDTALFGECKWTNSPTSERVLEKLDDITRHLFRHSKRHLWLFSRGGFTKGCVEAAKRIPNVRLITFEEMVREVETMPTP